MKSKALIFGGILLLLVGGFSVAMAKTDVPQAVKDAFALKFPKAKAVKWEMEDEGEYEAEFKLDGKKMSANFATDGSWLETEMEIKEADLPQAVSVAIAAQFPGYELEEIEQVEKPGMAMVYEVELEGEGQEIEAVFDAAGTLLHQSAEEGEEDDDN